MYFAEKWLIIANFCTNPKIVFVSFTYPITFVGDNSNKIINNMKKLIKSLLVVAAALTASSAIAQSETYPWAIKIGANAVDFVPESAPFSDARLINPEYFNQNIIPSISEISVSRYIKNGFSATLGGSINRIGEYGNFDPVRSVAVDDWSYFAVEGSLNYDVRQLKDSWKSGWFAPYAGIGLGYHWIEDDGAFSGNLSGGIDFWITENFAIYVETTYKGVIGEYGDADGNIVVDNASIQSSHLQHSAGVKFAFGGTDTDGDGINDKKDECPDTPGLEQFNGCPDSDLDGIKDSEDNCPNEVGKPENGGCPDSDGDGIIDRDDACPNVAGEAALKGCPDSDGDGVANNIDNCPNVAGPAANNGCPYKDSDNDGVLDKEDKCVNVPGVKANDGCPEVKVVTKEVQQTLNAYAKTILFDSGRSTIKSQSEVVLDDIVAILREYPKARFTIDGHTDHVGGAAGNQRLSESRASAVKAYLIGHGISQSNLSSRGFGESAPIADNATKAGRKLNRRVEINLIK